MPNGNEAGVNENWVPGGFTSGDMVEAVNPQSGEVVRRATKDFDNIAGQTFERVSGAGIRQMMGVDN